MRNKWLETFVIIVFINILLIAFAFTPKFSISTGAQDSLSIKFPAFSELLEFDKSISNNAADSLIEKYIFNTYLKSLRKSLSDIGPKTENEFFSNPEVGNSYALDDFFFNLKTQSDSEIVRIAHYGDSQLEGDRISCYLRAYFQEKFGGSGIGYIPFDDIADNASYVRYTSPNWYRYTVFHSRYGSGYYGMSGNVFKFSKFAVKKIPVDTSVTASNDTLQVKKNIIYNSATITIKLGPQVAYSKASLMYGHSSKACMMKVYNASSGENIISDSLPASEDFSLYPLVLKSLPRSIRLEFSGNVSPDFYGLLLDGNKGVQVDNYAIRGHSGDGLLLINPSYLARQIRVLNTKLIILQYGANVVPSARSEKACEAMGDMYYSIFMQFKKAVPGISVIVIGAGDMATKINGEYMSYPMLPKVVEAQKKAALKAGCAFWNLFEVMGGENSINTWVRKGLASNDGHFSHKGQQLIGKELFNTIITEYNQYLYRQRNTQKI